MLKELLKNDFKKNMWRNVILLLFMTLSAAIAISVCLMLTQLFTSISSMYEKARPPHFLQMHKGELNQVDLDAFNEGYSGVTHWQTVPMIDVQGEDLTVNTISGKTRNLSDCRLDLSLVRQNENYDVLLDENMHCLKMNQGEIGVPVILLDQYEIKIGDVITLESGETIKKFVVSAYVYDAQMNSTLCSSTRFLISNEDFSELFENVGETEYLIEAYFKDSSMAAAYQTAYEESEKNLPKDGQAVTYTMIFLLSALTDMMMAMVFLLAGILLGVIALLCLRYCLMAELEEDAKEIGTMKAIGISERGIQGLYLGKIRILMTAGILFGWMFSFEFQSFLTGHMRRTFGNQKTTVWGYLLAFLISILGYGFVVLYTRSILKKMRKVSIVDLLVTERGFSKERKSQDGMYRAKKIPMNLLVGLREVRRGYGVILLLLLLLSFLMMTPYRMADTLESHEFVTYMGSPLCDVLLEVEEGEELEERTEAARGLLNDQSMQGKISRFEMLRRIRLQSYDNEGNLVGLHIDTGSTAGEGLKYLSGKNPKKDTEIALSSLMAEELDKTVGDKMILLSDKTKKECTVSGIYQDVTSGGRTSKMICEFPQETAEKYTFQIQMSENADVLRMIENWRERLGSGYSIERMEEFLKQTLGGVSAQVKQSSLTVIILALCLAGLIVFLFMKLRIAKEMGMLATKRAMGISMRDIFLQELYPVLLSGGSGVLIGVILTEYAGEFIVSALFGLLGIGLDRIEFSSIPVAEVVGLSTALLMVPIAMVYLSCRELRKMNVTDYLNEE